MPADLAASWHEGGGFEDNPPVFWWRLSAGVQAYLVSCGVCVGVDVEKIVCQKKNYLPKKQGTLSLFFSMKERSQRLVLIGSFIPHA